MDESLRIASCTGNISDLYALIQRDGNVLRRFEEVEFIETPLHIAAEEGCTRFAMEMMNLKPSFARKLNKQGLSPLHLAIKNGHKEMALRFLGIDKDLVRVKGKNGNTPLHFLCEAGDQDGLLYRFLQVCPDSIRDVTIENQTALHIATKNNRLDVVQVLVEMLLKKHYCQEVVNRKDEDGNTALHLAASNNQPQMLELLLNCKADKYATNQVGSTALGVAEQNNSKESIIALRGCYIPGVSNFKIMLEKRIFKYVTQASSLIFQEMDNLSSEDRNTLLVILGLLLAATYQASLSPPGGVWQGENSSESKGSHDALVVGRSIMSQSEFLALYIPTYLGFIVTFFLTLVLLKPFPRGFRSTLQILLSLLALCFHQSMYTIAPLGLAFVIINIFSGLIFVLMVFMSIAQQVSKFSVSIVGNFILPWYFIFKLGGMGVVGIGKGFFVYLFLSREFLKGTLIVVGYCIYAGIVNFQGGDSIWKLQLIPFIGCWIFLNLCRFCIERCTKYCKNWQLSHV